jgi:NADH-quinone oxidoreductase subunit A
MTPGREYVAVLITALVASAIPALFITASRFLSPRKPSVVKSEAFECGNPATGPAWGRFSVKFYLTAILFIVFDVEVVFLYPWAIVFRRLGMVGFVEMLVFVAILTLGLAYVWRKGALEWD